MPQKRSFAIEIKLNEDYELVAECFNAVLRSNIKTESETECCKSRTTVKTYCKQCGELNPKKRTVYRADPKNTIPIVKDKYASYKKLTVSSVSYIPVPIQCITGKSYTIKPGSLYTVIYSMLYRELENMFLYLVSEDGVPYVITNDGVGLILTELRCIEDTDSGLAPPFTNLPEEKIGIETTVNPPLSVEMKLTKLLEDYQNEKGKEVFITGTSK